MQLNGHNVKSFILLSLKWRGDSSRWLKDLVYVRIITQFAEMPSFAINVKQQQHGKTFDFFAEQSEIILWRVLKQRPRLKSI